MPIIKFNTKDGSADEPRATTKQCTFIASLFIDCGFGPAQGRDYLNSRYGVKYADELSVRQASLVIDDLKCRKDQIKLPIFEESEDE